MKEYVNKFNQLARFGLELVDILRKKALRFAKGLNEPLHGLAMSHIPMGETFERLVDMALMHEKIKLKRKKLRLRKHKTRMCGPRKNNNKGAESTTRLKAKINAIVAGTWVI